LQEREQIRIISVISKPFPEPRFVYHGNPRMYLTKIGIDYLINTIIIWYDGPIEGM
jgi:hypothetical protein